MIIPEWLLSVHISTTIIGIVALLLVLVVARRATTKKDRRNPESQQANAVQDILRYFTPDDDPPRRRAHFTDDDDHYPLPTLTAAAAAPVPGPMMREDLAPPPALVPAEEAAPTALQLEAALRQAKAKLEFQVLVSCYTCEAFLARLHRLQNPRDRSLLFFNQFVMALEISGKFTMAQGLTLHLDTRIRDDLITTIGESTVAINRLIEYLADGDLSLASNPRAEEKHEHEHKNDDSLWRMIQKKAKEADIAAPEQTLGVANAPSATTAKRNHYMISSMTAAWKLNKRRTQKVDDPSVTNLELVLMLTNVVEFGLGFLGSFIASACDEEVALFATRAIEGLHDELTQVVEFINMGRDGPDRSKGETVFAKASQSFTLASSSLSAASSAFSTAASSSSSTCTSSLET